MKIEEPEEPSGLFILPVLLLILLLAFITITGFNPFRDCDVYTNSTFLKDCWFGR